MQVVGTLTGDPVGQEYTSGVMNFKDLTNDAFFDAFCVEPSVSMSFGDTPIYEIQDINLLANSDKISRLVGGYLASGKTAADAAAVQWAIWETTTETLSAASLSDGNVRVIAPSETAALANQFLLNVNSFAPVELVYLTSDHGQNVVSWNVIPEPGSAGLLAFSALCLFRRRR